MRHGAFISAVVVGASLLASTSAFATAADELSMHEFSNAACKQMPSQAGCFGYTKAQPAMQMHDEHWNAQKSKQHRTHYKKREMHKQMMSH
ncbi:hypothetical protein WJT86_03720 [Microvirga sp. W0021]|uniref:Uncharacterized protein n=1 Tax=Hohaiivirga grylli TaxID=3133970 RepID=A0ABV0BGU2_9HYPH